MELQWQEQCESTNFNADQNNSFKTHTTRKLIRSQDAVYDYWKIITKRKTIIGKIIVQ